MLHPSNLCVCVCVYIYIYTHTHTHMERERERERVNMGLCWSCSIHQLCVYVYTCVKCLEPACWRFPASTQCVNTSVCMHACMFVCMKYSAICFIYSVCKNFISNFLSCHLLRVKEFTVFHWLQGVLAPVN